jgi:hypothetical protein
MNNLIVRPGSEVSLILCDHWLNGSNFKVGLCRLTPLISIDPYCSKVVDRYGGIEMQNNIVAIGCLNLPNLSSVDSYRA